MAMTKTPKGMVKNKVAYGEGVKFQKDDKPAPALDSKGVGKMKTAKSTMVENKVAGGAGVKIQSPQNRVADLNDMGVGKMTQKSGMVVHKVR